jgi:hypothetical protein
MAKYIVNYSEYHILEIVVEAVGEDEARRIVSDGEADYDKEREIDCSLVNVNSVQEVTE